jgi:hypothetical protein
MGFYGDLDPCDIFPSSRIWDMSTAIARIYTSEGFAVAADGRGTTQSGIATDTAQKIFPICDPNKSLAYSLAGTVGFTSNDGQTIFDFRSETAKALQATDTSGATTLDEYVTQLCVPIEATLRGLIDGEQSSNYPTGEPAAEPGVYVIARIFFDGYYRDVPSQTTAIFQHKNGALCPTFVERIAVRNDAMNGSGSGIIFNLLYGDKRGWFDTYKPHRTKNLTLAEATAQVKAYVDACSDPRALEIDGQVCKKIGGHVHSATITKTGGFKWEIEPLKYGE